MSSIFLAGMLSGVLGWKRYIPGVATVGLTSRYGALISSGLIGGDCGHHSNLLSHTQALLQ